MVRECAVIYSQPRCLLLTLERCANRRAVAIYTLDDGQLPL